MSLLVPASHLPACLPAYRCATSAVESRQKQGAATKLVNSGSGCVDDAIRAPLLSKVEEISSLNRSRKQRGRCLLPLSGCGAAVVSGKKSEVSRPSHKQEDFPNNQVALF